MTITTSEPAVPHYTPAPVTKEDLEYADLEVIDLSKANTPEGVARLAEQARDAMRDKGFFYVINHGLSPEETTRIFDIADVVFTQTTEEEKERYKSKLLETGSYQGFKQRQYWHIDGGVLDQVETYNIHRDVGRKGHPEALRPVLPEVARFAQHNHFNVLYVILRLLAVGMELPEDTFVKQHEYDADSETYVRFMKYYPRSEEDEIKTNNVWLKGHTGG
ncbi:hypothetical protein NM688_g6591 [Phlebia brevispora]|uniref:Uncharacterized protein n=1 Tax=Phlebia brevispora TaxID=194682 RepID=A0ACC1SEH0_9APHY|nr:hypothetical protein NM688_g6591 [Phlebia brevispora]